MLDEDVNKLVEGEDSDANQFPDEMMLSNEDPGTRINLGSHKESIEAEKVSEYVSIDEEEDSLIPDIQQQLYMKMRDDEHAHIADFALWIALKYKYKKSSSHVEPCRNDAFHRQDHEDHHDD
nr:hypothetical protein [Tanacetum cinerariifolium]